MIYTNKMTTLIKQNGTYVIKPGDDLTKIASSQGRSVSDLLSLNPQYKANPNLILPGQTLNLGGTAPSLDNSTLSPQVNASNYTLPAVSNNTSRSPVANSPMTVNLPDTPGSSITTQGSAPVNNQNSGSLADIMTKIFKDYQTNAAGQYTGNNTALLKGKENIDATNSDVYSQDFNNANISNAARLSLLGGDQGLQSSGLKSITDQQQANQAHYNTSNDILKTTEDTYNKEQDRIKAAAQSAADQAYKDKLLAETIRHNKAGEAVDQQKNAPATGANELKTNALNSAQALLSKFDAGSGTSAVGGDLLNRLGPVGDFLGEGTSRQDFIVQLNNLKSLLSLDNVKLLKGQGAISNEERLLLEQASSKLDRSQSEGEFRSALADIVKELGGGTGTTAGTTPGSINLGSTTSSGIGYTLIP